MENKILVETSARHLHLSAEHIDILFGAGHQLTVKKMLSQPGQFACEEKVTVQGEKGWLSIFFTVSSWPAPKRMSMCSAER